VVNERNDEKDTDRGNEFQNLFRHNEQPTVKIDNDNYGITTDRQNTDQCSTVQLLTEQQFRSDRHNSLN